MSDEARERIENIRKKKVRNRKKTREGPGRPPKLIRVENLSEVYGFVGVRVSPSEIRSTLLTLISFPPCVLEQKVEEAHAFSWYVGFMAEEILKGSKFISEILRGEIANAAKIEMEQEISKLAMQQIKEARKERAEIPENQQQCEEAYYNIIRGLDD